MQVVWMDEAKQQLNRAVAYGIITFGQTETIHFVDEIERNNIRLASFPLLGQVEFLLAGRPREYRSLVVYKHYKMIYYIDSNVIYIVALWDTRSNPQNLSAKVK